MITNLAHRPALLGGDVGNPYRRGGDGLDRRDDFIQRAVGGLSLVGGCLGMLKLRTHALYRFSCSLLQAADQGLDLASGTRGALSQRAYFFGHHGKAAAHFPGTCCLNRSVQGQQVGLFGNRANDREHTADGGRLLGQLFDHLGVALHFIDQRTQAGQALADHRLALLHRASGIAAGIGGLAGIAGDLQDGCFQLAQGIADLRGVPGLTLGACMQSAAHAGQGMAAACDLFRVAADGSDQLHQIQAQTVE
ncbi:hypothetical protein D3C80_898760 [compost metagenome]